MLLYIAREYEKLTSKREEFPDYAEMKLSDSYKLKNESCFLELAVKVYNINKGRNAGLASVGGRECFSVNGT